MPVHGSICGAKIHHIVVPLTKAPPLKLKMVGVLRYNFRKLPSKMRTLRSVAHAAQASRTTERRFSQGPNTSALGVA